MERVVTLVVIARICGQGSCPRGVWTSCSAHCIKIKITHCSQVFITLLSLPVSSDWYPESAHQIFHNANDVFSILEQDESSRGMELGVYYKGVLVLEMEVKSLPGSPLLICFTIMTADSHETVRFTSTSLVPLKHRY